MLNPETGFTMLSPIFQLLHSLSLFALGMGGGLWGRGGINKGVPFRADHLFSVLYLGVSLCCSLQKYVLTKVESKPDLCYTHKFGRQFDQVND